ncbi:MAG: radical SAM protein [Thermoplasmatales archaeon]
MLMSWKVKDGVIGLADDFGRVLSLDYEGRLLFFSENGVTYRRTLLNRFIELKIEDGKRIVREVPMDTAKSVVLDARSFFEKAIANHPPPGLNDRVYTLTERINYDWLVRDAQAFTLIYGGGVPIVPPDQYFSLYLRYSEGCPWNKCSFCMLYPETVYRVKTLDDMSKQIDSLLAVLGRGIESRQSVFLGDANAINTDTDLLIDVLALVKRRIGLPVYAFTDAFTTMKNKKIGDFIRMRENGLTRVYIGIESGDQYVLKLLNKPMDISGARREIEDIKRAGIGVGVIVMSGAGGKALAREHVESTARFIATLPLGKGDVVYISPLREYEGSEYAKIASEKGLGIMSGSEKLDQAEDIRSEIKEIWIRKFSLPPEFQIAPYILEESVY